MAKAASAKSKRAELDQKARDQAVRWLWEHISPGATLYTIVRKRSRDNMSICVLVLVHGMFDIKNASSIVSDALGLKWDSCGGVWTDTEFGVIQSISHAIHGSDDVGRPKRTPNWSPRPSPTEYQAGHSIIHKTL